MEEKRQEDVDTMIKETGEKLEVSGAVHSQVWVLSAALPSGELTPTDSPPTAPSVVLAPWPTRGMKGGRFYRWR